MREKNKKHRELSLYKKHLVLSLFALEQFHSLKFLYLYLFLAYFLFFLSVTFSAWASMWKTLGCGLWDYVYVFIISTIFSHALSQNVEAALFIKSYPWICFHVFYRLPTIFTWMSPLRLYVMQKFAAGKSLYETYLPWIYMLTWCLCFKGKR